MTNLPIRSQWNETLKRMMPIYQMGDPFEAYYRRTGPESPEHFQQYFVGQEVMIRDTESNLLVATFIVEVTDDNHVTGKINHVFDPPQERR